MATCIGGLVAIYWSTVTAVVTNWSRDPFGHGYAVVPIVLFLSWKQRELLASLNPIPSLWPLAGLAGFAFLWLLGNLSATTIVQQFCLVGMIAMFVWAVLGNALMKALLFPVGLLLFALPVGDRLVPVLQDFAARFAVELLRLIRVPVLLEGHVLSIPGSSWQVAEACSGINYLVSSLAVGYIYAGLSYRRWTHRVGFLAAAAVAPLIANGLRVFTTILIASFGATGVAAGLGHNLFGVIVFALTTYVLVATCGHWREDGDGDRSARQPARPEEPTSSNWRVALVAGLGLLLVGAAPISAQLLRLEAAPEKYGDPFAARVSGSWKAADSSLYGWRPRVVDPSAESLGTYESGPLRVEMYVASYRATQPGVKVATASNVLFAHPWWISGDGRVSVRVAGQSFHARETTIRSPQRSLRVWSWYSVAGTATGDDYIARFLLAKARLLRNPLGAAVIAIATEDVQAVDSRGTLMGFVENLSFDWSSEE